MAHTQQQWDDAVDKLIEEAIREKRSKHLTGFFAAIEKFPALYPTFERFTYEAISAGMKKCSADFVYHRMRWFTSVDSRMGNDDLKLNNNYCTYFGRLFCALHPEHADLFERRAPAHSHQRPSDILYRRATNE